MGTKTTIEFDDTTAEYLNELIATDGSMKNAIQTSIAERYKQLARKRALLDWVQEVIDAEGELSAKERAEIEAKFI